MGASQRRCWPAMCFSCCAGPGRGTADAQASESSPMHNLNIMYRATPICISRPVRRSAVLIAAMLLASACGDNGGRANPDAPVTAVDAIVNNPRNPNGLGPAPVIIGPATDLTQAGAYVLLAKTGITNVTGSLISGGHLGLSPAPAGALTGFSETADATGLFSTSASVMPPSKIYTTGNTSPTPSNLTTAVLSMQAAYTDAASRTNPDKLNLSDGNLSGLTLAPGLYRWGSVVTIGTDITLAGGPNDVWIFQISDRLILSTATAVILSGGAQAKNIFWVVAGQVTLHTNAHFEGILFAQTGITMQTNASWTGRGLAQSLVALDNNKIKAP